MSKADHHNACLCMLIRYLMAPANSNGFILDINLVKAYCFEYKQGRDIILEINLVKAFCQK